MRIFKLTKEYETEELWNLYLFLNIFKVVTGLGTEVLKGIDYLGDVGVNGSMTLNSIS
jgi:hypothetical protein